VVPAYLEVSRSDGAEFVELTGDLLTIGRSEGSDAAFPLDAAVSSKHAVLQRVSAGWLLRDAGSSNGTYVNGARLEGERLLVAGDEVVVGGGHMVFRGGDRAAATATHQPTEDEGPLELREEWGTAPEVDPALAPAIQVATADSSAPAVAKPESAHHLVDPGNTTASAIGPGRVRGVARAVQVRSREERSDVLEFRLERYDAEGNRLPPVAVVYEGYKGGQVSEGDEVEVSGRWSHGAVKARRVTNLSTGAEVHGLPAWTKVVMVVVVALFICFFTFIIISIITASQVENPFE
jgi:hypothetical protein